MWQGDEFPFEGRRRKCTESCVEKLRNGVKDNVDEKFWEVCLKVCADLREGWLRKMSGAAHSVVTPQETREGQLQLRGSQRQHWKHE